MSIRKKRNFRDLQLPAASLGPEEPVASRLAPLGPRQRPPPLQNGALLVPDLLSPPQSTSLQASLSSTIAKLELDAKPQYKEFDLKNDDFNILQELGQGNGGSVMKVQHVPTGTVMAKKVRFVSRLPAQII